ncbi:MAG: glutamate synthase subunit beta [Gordonia sp. (in: high G+C Gram-positive bacteria)]|uniref:glutamate synthase subunit beta n=1 Tax=Gordonia sp. (in: high G+C Gram-positive bacteria) TaxID=84139 RepID=UPI003C72A036
MADPRGFLKHTERHTPVRRPVELRLLDWKEVYTDFDKKTLETQASRCMDCGVPFCHNGCPLGNLIPEWNDLVYREQWDAGMDRLHATNNFPEFTGRLCPAPCESSCVLGINQPAVTIKQVERELIENAWGEDYVTPVLPTVQTGKKVAVVGSGPAGLAAAQQLTRAGHEVTVFERADRIGGLLRYGIPEFKMEKRIIDRRLAQMTAEGTVFQTGVNVGVDVTVEELRADFDAVILANGSTIGRDLPIPGRELDGIHQAMEYLPQANRVAAGDTVDGQITAEGKHVVIIGGGDTGADCLGTALRQGAAQVHQFEIMPRPPSTRAESTPWPLYPLMFRVSSAHEEGGERVFSVNTESFVGDGGTVTGLKAHEVKMVGGRFEKVEDSDFELKADLVLLAMGFVGPERGDLLDDYGVTYTDRGNIDRGADFGATGLPGVFVAGDAGRGQSLIVWAIAEGRSAAAGADAYLMGSTQLPSPITPTMVAQR